MKPTTKEPRRIRQLRAILGETRSLERIREHYELEKRLAARLSAAGRQERAALYTRLYDEMMRTVGDGLYHRVRSDARYLETQRRRALKLLRPFLRPESVYLELGPGDCNVALAVARQVQRVYAIDVSREISARDDYPPNFALIISDGTSVPLPAESIDVAYSNQLMEHLHPDDALQQLQNIHRVLRRGAVYVCRTPNALSGPHDVSAFFDEVASGFHLKEYTYGELRGLFGRAGFRRLRATVGGRGINLPFRTRLAPLVAVERLLTLLPTRLHKALARTLPMRFILNIQLVATK